MKKWLSFIKLWLNWQQSDRRRCGNGRDDVWCYVQCLCEKRNEDGVWTRVWTMVQKFTVIVAVWMNVAASLYWVRGDLNVVCWDDEDVKQRRVRIEDVRVRLKVIRDAQSRTWKMRVRLGYCVSRGWWRGWWRHFRQNRLLFNCLFIGELAVMA